MLLMIDNYDSLTCVFVSDTYRADDQQ